VKSTKQWSGVCLSILTCKYSNWLDRRPHCPTTACSIYWNWLTRGWHVLSQGMRAEYSCFNGYFQDPGESRFSYSIFAGSEYPLRMNQKYTFLCIFIRNFLSVSPTHFPRVWTMPSLRVHSIAWDYWQHTLEMFQVHKSQVQVQVVNLGVQVLDQQIPLPLTISCSSKSRLVRPIPTCPSYLPGSTFLVLAHPGPRQKPKEL